ncbi:hypothetical protein C8F04DRAFT_1252419 [Mycena alexandri]|uniref:Uncharacterized protein n=1 Tax=Mycena alexandri TaxID=1745969 RepID=A0AAD6TDG3_9AGAR|nr:hypothetical protein C8F04DRAFT_1252419 [Mycena alexandri]
MTNLSPPYPGRDPGLWRRGEEEHGRGRAVLRSLPSATVALLQQRPIRSPDLAHPPASHTSRAHPPAVSIHLALHVPLPIHPACPPRAYAAHGRLALVPRTSPRPPCAYAAHTAHIHADAYAAHVPLAPMPCRHTHLRRTRPPRTYAVYVPLARPPRTSQLHLRARPPRTYAAHVRLVRARRTLPHVPSHVHPAHSPLHVRAQPPRAYAAPGPLVRLPRTSAFAYSPLRLRAPPPRAYAVHSRLVRPPRTAPSRIRRAHPPRAYAMPLSPTLAAHHLDHRREHHPQPHTSSGE